MLTVPADTRELVVWTEKTSLEEAKSVFSQFHAAIRSIPSPKLAGRTKCGVFVFYLPEHTKETNIASALRTLESSQASTIVFYVPNHSSDFAFRVGKLVGSFKFQETEWAFNMQHLRQLLRIKNVAVVRHPGQSLDQGGTEMVQLRKRLGLTQSQLAEAFGVTARTLQSWEKGVGISQLKRKMRDLTELTALMDEYVSAPKEREWLSSPLSALRNKTPRELIAGGRVRDLIVEFLRLREGQPV
jgi:transcriptional regulator with XRE-family HTH domain